MNALVVCALWLAAVSPLEEGQARWRDMELETAAAHFERAVTIAHDDTERAEALVWLGLARAELGDFSRAKTAFMRALRLRSDVVLPKSAGELAPRVRGLFEAAKLEVEGPRALPRDLPDEPLPPIYGEAPPASTTPVVVKRHGEAPALLVVGAVALAGSGVMLMGTAAIVDAAAGPELFDGGTTSIVVLGAGAVLLLAGGGLGAVALLAD